MNYKPDSSQASARYQVAPFQKLFVQLDGVDRSNGFVDPSVEGTFLFIEKTDYPFLLSVVSPLTNERQTFVARSGLAINGTFKGLTITHPFIAAKAAPDFMGASIIIGKSDDTFETANEFALPFAGWPAIATTTNTAIAQLFDIHVPPGSRFCTELNIVLGATTIATAAWLLNARVAGNNFAIQSPSFTVPEGAFTTAIPAQGVFDVSVPLAGVAVSRLKDANFPISYSAKTISVNIGGTGLSQPVSVKAVFA